MAKKEQPKAVEKVEDHPGTGVPMQGIEVTDGQAVTITSTGLEGLVGKTIDERMADLYEDHKRMGARE